MARKENALIRWMPVKLRNRVKELLQFTGSILTPYLIINPSLSSKFYSFNSTSNEYVVEGPDFDKIEKDKDGLPIPPKSLRIGEMSAEDFVSSGASRVQSMLSILEEGGFPFHKFSTVLEFGCSSGRMIRCLTEYAKEREIWGVDLASEHIYWNQQYLSPPFYFATVTSAPHLPFEDNYFDFIYAGSVFTHIDDLADACFLELRRVLKKQGIFYVTVFDSHSLDIMKQNFNRSEFFQLILNSKAYKKFNQSNGKIFTVGRSLMSYVVYDREYIVSHLNRIFEVTSVVNEAYSGYQTGIVLQKR